MTKGWIGAPRRSMRSVRQLESRCSLDKCPSCVPLPPRTSDEVEFRKNSSCPMVWEMLPKHFIILTGG
eukprot:6452712-Amphidinium_carterae.1